MSLFMFFFLFLLSLNYHFFLSSFSQMTNNIQQTISNPPITLLILSITFYFYGSCLVFLHSPGTCDQENKRIKQSTTNVEDLYVTKVVLQQGTLQGWQSNKISYKAGDKQGNKVGDEQGNKVGDEQGNKVGDEQGNKVGDEQGNKVGDEQGNKVGDEQDMVNKANGKLYLVGDTYNKFDSKKEAVTKGTVSKSMKKNFDFI
ncbi:hypothetical protein BDC45DRAFT_535350 [Circinella umbellata]|nr:hypothetical protein BDC45DRAFT_535350 [Circinella umbellata]